MEDTVMIIKSVIYTLDNLGIRGRITENAPAYNQIIACINSLNQAVAKLEGTPESSQDSPDE